MCGCPSCSELDSNIYIFLSEWFLSLNLFWKASSKGVPHHPQPTQHCHLSFSFTHCCNISLVLKIVLGKCEKKKENRERKNTSG